MSMHDTSGFDGDSKKMQRVSFWIQAMIASAVAAELMATVTPTCEKLNGFRLRVEDGCYKPRRGRSVFANECTAPGRRKS